MEERIEARAGLNGSGAGHGGAQTNGEVALASVRGVETGRPLTQTARLEAVMADSVRRADIHRRVTQTVEPLESIATDHGVSPKRLGEWARDHRWPRPPGAPRGPKRRPMPIFDGSGAAGDEVNMAKDKLIGVLDRQIELVDKRLRTKGAEVEEKDSRILGNLAKTLSTLMDMGKGGQTSKDAEAPARGEDVERRLAERIKAWARGEQGY